ncbi:MAG TPA: nicotinate-nucleotide adenylyltransferase [Candidatus Caenarcaniphilales bacterium]
MTRIALFGTSADPPTAGHQAILEQLSQGFDQVVVWASDNPFKIHQTPLYHRQEMLRLLIQDMPALKQNVALCTEFSDPKALITVKRASQRWPEAKLTFVVGSDLVPKLCQWYRIDAVLSQVQLLVIPRPSYPLVERDLEQLRSRGAKIGIAKFSGPDVSSSAYRDQGKAAGITPAVAAYIHHQGLYPCVDSGVLPVSEGNLPGPVVIP